MPNARNSSYLQEQAVGAWHLSNSGPKLHTNPQLICWDAFMTQHSWYVKLHVILRACYSSLWWNSYDFLSLKTLWGCVSYSSNLVELYFPRFVNSAGTWTAADCLKILGKRSYVVVLCMCLSSAVCLCCLIYNSPTAFKVQLLELLQTETHIYSAQPSEQCFPSAFCSRDCRVWSYVLTAYIIVSG